MFTHASTMPAETIHNECICSGCISLLPCSASFGATAFRYVAPHWMQGAGHLLCRADIIDLDPSFLVLNVNFSELLVKTDLSPLLLCRVTLIARI